MDKKLTGGAAAMVGALLYGGAQLLGMGAVSYTHLTLPTPPYV